MQLSTPSMTGESSSLSPETPTTPNMTGESSSLSPEVPTTTDGNENPPDKPATPTQDKVLTAKIDNEALEWSGQQTHTYKESQEAHLLV